MAPEPGTLRAALAHRSYRRLLTASAISQTGDWLYNVALLFYVYDATGSPGWVALVSGMRLAPFVLFAPLGGLIADRVDRRRCLVVADLLRSGIMVLLTLAAAGDLHVLVPAFLAFAASTAGAGYIPALVGLVPDLVGERDLVAANSAASLVENVSTVAGPMVGALLLAATSPEVAFAANAATFGVSAALTVAVRAPVVRDGTPQIRPAGDHRPAGGRRRLSRAWSELSRGVRAIAGSAPASALSGYVLATAYIYGLQTVLLVTVAEDRLHGGSGTLGLLYAGLGAGGVLAAFVTARVARSHRLAGLLGASLACAALPMAGLAAADAVPVAFVLVLVAGLGAVIVDVLALTVLQRTVAGEVLGRAWGLLDATAVGAMLAGGFVVAPTVAALGDSGALVVLPVLALVAVPLGARGVRAAALRSGAVLEEIAPRLAVFERVAIFHGAPPAVIERLAMSARTQRYPAEASVVVQGEPASDLYVVESGRLEVVRLHDDGRASVLATLGPGDYFGEIGILRGVPRTATVYTLEDVTVWAVDGNEFLAALGDAPALHSSMADAVVHRVATHDPAAVLADASADAPVRPATDATTRASDPRE